MKNKFLFLVAIILFIFSCTPTNEERAEDLISDCIKDYLTYPKSYESIYTQIDSSYVNPLILEEIIELSKECVELYDEINNFERKIEFAQSTMEIYTPNKYSSEFTKGNYNRAKAEKEEYELEIKQLNPKLEEKVFALRNSVNSLYDTDINGWAVTHRFRCKNDNGIQMPPQEMVFFCNLDFEECQGWTTRQIESIFEIIECVNESETDKVLLNNLKDIRSVFFFL